MALKRTTSDDHSRSIKRFSFWLSVFILLVIFLTWRVDSPRVERVRAYVFDVVAPVVDTLSTPILYISSAFEVFQNATRLYEQNKQLREELRQMRAWREAAIQLEQQNARLLDLNKVYIAPKLTHVSGRVMADSGSPFRQSVLINAGARVGVLNGWAAMDGLGLVGRIAGVAQNTSRVLLLTDTNSQIPVTIQPAGQKALLSGDNSRFPLLSFVEKPSLVQPGDRVITSGDGGLFPPNLLVGQVSLDHRSELRVALAADYSRLEVLKVLRSHAVERVADDSIFVVPLPMLDEFYGPPTAQQASDGGFAKGGR